MLTEKLYPIVQEQVRAGWLLKEKMAEFEKIYSALDKDKEYLACELGVFYGFSAIAQGVLIKELGLNVKLYAVDAWSKSASVEGTQSEENKKWWAEQDYAAAYHSFCNSIAYFKLDKIVIPVIGKSEDVAELIPEGLCLCHFDSNHVPEVISKEFLLYVPKLLSGGIAVLDDFFWQECNKTYLEYTDKMSMDKVWVFEKDGQGFAIYKKP